MATHCSPSTCSVALCFLVLQQNSPQYIVTHCNTLQHTYTHSSAMSPTTHTLQPTTTHCTTLQRIFALSRYLSCHTHTATHYNTLQVKREGRVGRGSKIQGRVGSKIQPTSNLSLLHNSRALVCERALFVYGSSAKKIRESGDSLCLIGSA